MRRRGFTAMELAICLTILIILVPLVYQLATIVEENHAIGLWQLQTAEELRTVAEELRLDQRQGTPEPGEAVAWARQGCTVHYRVDPQRVLLREAPEACGGSRALATHVAGFRRLDEGVEIEFVNRLRPTIEQRERVFIPLEAP